MRSTCIILLLVASLQSFSQKEYNKVKDVPDRLFFCIEQNAYPNMVEWRKFLDKELVPRFVKMADSLLIPAGTYKIFCRFIVDKNGSLRDIVALQDPYGLGALTVKVAMMYPKKWTPAMQSGRKVQSYHMQPVTYIISDEEEEEDSSEIISRPLEKIIIDPALFKVVDEPIALQPGFEEKIIAEKCIREANPFDEKAWLQYLQAEMDKAFKGKLPAGSYNSAVSMIIDKDGNVAEVKIIGDPGFGIAERLRVAVMKYSGKWKHALLHGRPIRSIYTQSFLYKVEADCITGSSPLYY